jgi:VWFA-related protein
MKRLTLATLLTVVLILGLVCTPIVGYADGPTVQVTQVDPSAFPRVTLYVSVTDEAGEPIGGLKQEDFDLQEDGQPVEILEFAGIGSDRPVDIVFVFDTTGSMDDEIEGVKNTSIAFANKLRASNRDFRLGLVAFGDEIRSVDNRDGTLTADAEEFKRWVGRLRADGGGDDEEMALDALMEGGGMQFRPDAQKILLLITDAPPHERGDGTHFSRTTASETATTLKDNGFTVYAVAYNDARFRQIVDVTGGDFYDIRRERDFTGIIDRIGGLIANQYRIVYQSHRPAYDGTRRPVTVTVGGSTGESVYTEEHMLNVQSSPLAAVLLAMPLLAALLLPVVWPRVKGAKPVAPPPEPAMAPQPGPWQPPPSSYPPYASPAGPVYPAPPQPPAPPVYPAPAAGPPMPAAQPTAGAAPCVRCGQPVRAGAKFCTVCGQPAAAASAPQPAATCPRCGQPLRPGAKFCARCGARFV